MNAICFEIKAPFATFKDPKTTRGYFSFPFPPKTALIGLIGGILGVPHNECYRKEHFLMESKLALQLLAMPRYFSCRTNETQTKMVQSLFGMKIGIPHPSLDRGFSSPQTTNLLSNVVYRIFICMDESHQQELSKRLEKHEYIYAPFLGRANMLAEIEYQGMIEIQPIRSTSNHVSLITIFDTDSVTDVKGTFVIIPNIPNSYEIHEIESKVGTERITMLQVQTRSLINIGYGKEQNFKEIQILPSENGLKRLYKITTSKKITEINGKHILFLPD